MGHMASFKHQSTEEFTIMAQIWRLKLLRGPLSFRWSMTGVSKYATYNCPTSWWQLTSQARTISRQDEMEGERERERPSWAHNLTNWGL